jgi:hypothetical protein
VRANGGGEVRIEGFSMIFVGFGTVQLGIVVALAVVVALVGT